MVFSHLICQWELTITGASGFMHGSILSSTDPQMTMLSRPSCSWMGFIATDVKFATQTDPKLMSDLHGQFNPACARLYV